MDALSLDEDDMLPIRPDDEHHNGLFREGQGVFINLPLQPGARVGGDVTLAVALPGQRRRLLADRGFQTVQRTLQ